MDKYLNLTVLTYFYNRIKTFFATKSEIPTKTSDLTNDSDFATTSQIPTKTSDLTNDGDGQSNFATESYVDLNGGKIDSISVNGTAQTIDANKNVDLSVASLTKTQDADGETFNIVQGNTLVQVFFDGGTGHISINGYPVAMPEDIPTRTSNLTNDSGFITNAVNDLINYYTKSQTYTQSEVDALIAGISTVDFLIVQTLPTQDISTSTIYLVPKGTSQTQNVYDEYVYINNDWELIGTTQIDLSNYWSKTDLVAITTAEIDTMLAA